MFKPIPPAANGLQTREPWPDDANGRDEDENGELATALRSPTGNRAAGAAADHGLPTPVAGA